MAEHAKDETESPNTLEVRAGGVTVECGRSNEDLKPDTAEVQAGEYALIGEESTQGKEHS